MVSFIDGWIRGNSIKDFQMTIAIINLILTILPPLIKLFFRGKENKAKKLREFQIMIDEKIKQTITIINERRDIQKQKEWFKKRDKENEKLIKGLKKDTE